MPALLINGVDAETFGFTLAEAPGWSDMPSRQVPTAPVIGRQGVKELADPQEQPRKLSLSGTLRGSSVADARTKLDALKLAFAAKPLQFVFADQSSRFVNARLDSFTSPPLVGSMVQSALRIDATFMCSDPYFYDALLAGVLINYAPGDVVTGEAFTRSTTATYIDGSGVVRTAAINSKRDSHFTDTSFGAVRTIRLEDARTNALLRSQEFDNAAWNKGGSTITADATTAPDGTATADKLNEDASNGAHYVTCQLTTTPNTFQPVTIFAKAAERTWLRLTSLDRATVARDSWINLSTGAVGTKDAAHIIRITALASGWYRVELDFNSGIGASAVQWFICIATGNGVPTYAGSAGSGIYIWGAQHEQDAAFASSYIPTTAAAVTRAADSYSMPFNTPPQEMTLYAKLTEAGTSVLSGNRRVAFIGSAANGTPQLALDAAGGFYDGGHNNGVTGVASALAVAPAIGDIVELVLKLYADGSIQVTQSINGGAETFAPQSVANALAGAWSAQLAWLNSTGPSFVGFNAFQSFKVATGIRSLGDMRALPRMPLGTAPIRPVVTIVGASVNPIITLYNKLGNPMASMSLTITTVAGDLVVIDMDAKTIKNSLGVSIIGILTAGDFFCIDPADQANFGAPGPNINSSSGALTVSYRRAWR